MSWRAGDWDYTADPNTFRLFCPYCGEEGEGFTRGATQMPAPRSCSDCERTYIIPVAVSRGGQSK